MKSHLLKAATAVLFPAMLWAAFLLAASVSLPACKRQPQGEGAGPAQGSGTGKAGALVVMPGATLTLEPGAVVWFRSLGLVVRGTIQARGTSENPVILSGLRVKGWKGIFLDGSGGQNTFRHCRVSGAEFGIRSARSRLTVEDCRFQENTWGLVAEDGQIDITGSLVRASAKTGIAAHNSRLSVRGSVITENASGGLLLEGSPASIEGNNIVNNGGWGIKTIGSPAKIKAGHNWWGKPNPDLSEIIKGAATLTRSLLRPAGRKQIRRTSRLYRRPPSSRRKN